MALTLQDIKNLIRVAQGEDELSSAMARTDILVEITDEHMERHIWKYTRKTTTGGMDPDDIRQVFLISCSLAIDEADLVKGNPLLFILQKGKWAVVDELRKGYRRNIRQYCHSCGTETRLNERRHIPICPQCGAAGDEHVERVQFNFTDDGTLSANVVDDKMDIGDVVSSESIVREFRERLTGRKADVFDLIMNDGYDRDSCKNYIREVADVLGVTPANVNLRLRQIKEAWGTYMDEMESPIMRRATDTRYQVVGGRDDDE
jgi:predicted RNA-binding Zn-ribbon protein involved in translation (DUF1610 family)